ncbi:RICIN domain-containing protein [Streptomyces sp. NPDC053431]|uniref:RICIN domain-containing protein n=1 Tax=Streptomyces sp. NPDC053431 TaxID=3365703 RepID=UPI0037D8F140
MRPHRETRSRRLLTTSTILLAGSALLLPIPAVAHPAAGSTTGTSASQARISGAAFQFRNLETGKCMTFNGGTLAQNNLELLQFDCDTHPSRRWRITNWNGDSYQLVNAQSGKCATVAGGRSTENNVELVQFTCDSDPSRRWRLTNWGGTSYQVVNVQTGKCATVAGGRSTDNNVHMVQFTCDDDRSRRWVVRLAGTPNG